MWIMRNSSMYSVSILVVVVILGVVPHIGGLHIHEGGGKLYDFESTFSDPLWKDSWYLLPDKFPSMKIVDAWNEGYTGKGVVVSVLGDGIEYTHPDLRDNYDSSASYDINRNDPDPSPRWTYINENRAGTRYAGIIAAKANNSVCSVGVAHNAKIGGVRMLDGYVSDEVEARSLGVGLNHIDIYLLTSGPDDDGRTVDGPSNQMSAALETGIKKGRHGKGSIYIVASGNGGRYEDDCNCDGYTSSIYTIPISSVNERNESPWYSERCSTIFAVTYSSGSTKDGSLVSTDLNGMCTKKVSGSAGAASLATGICALALEANPSLTWRDMQHLIVRTSSARGLLNGNWARNGAGYEVSHTYGYGMMDAYAMVNLAKKWPTAPEQRVCKISVTSSVGRIPARIPFQVSECSDGSPLPERLEHVMAKISAGSSSRGKMSIKLTSAIGTTSTLLHFRPRDNSYEPFTEWPFMSIHFWDENPVGNWVLNIESKDSVVGTLESFEIILHGTLNADWRDPNQFKRNWQPVSTTPPSESVDTQGSDENVAQPKEKLTTKLAKLEQILLERIRHYVDYALCKIRFVVLKHTSGEC